jgi:hypothetical protein
MAASMEAKSGRSMQLSDSRPIWSIGIPRSSTAACAGCVAPGRPLCVLDVFLSISHVLTGEQAQPRWLFTAVRPTPSQRPWARAGCRAGARAALVVVSDSLIDPSACFVSTAKPIHPARAAPEWSSPTHPRRGHDHDPGETNRDPVRLPGLSLHGESGHSIPERHLALLQRRLRHGAPQRRALPRRLWLRMPWLSLFRLLQDRFPWSCLPACTGSAAAAAAAKAGSVMAPTSAPAGCSASCGSSKQPR